MLSLADQTITESKNSVVGYYTIPKHKRLLILIDKFFISSRNGVLDTDIFYIDCSQLVISLYSLNYSLQNKSARYKLFLDWVKKISVSKHNYIKDTHENKIIDQPVDTKSPNVALLHYRDNNFSINRIIAGHHYISWNLQSDEDMIIYRYKSKSYNDYLVSLKKKNHAYNLLNNLDYLTSSIYSSGISNIFFLVSNVILEENIKRIVTQYSYHIMRVAREPKSSIEYSGTCLNKEALDYLMGIAFLKAIFESLDFRKIEFVVNKYYKSSEINVDKNSIAEGISGINEIKYFRYGEVFYSYTINMGSETRVINKRDLYMVTTIKRPNYHDFFIVFINPNTYQEMFYKLFTDYVICTGTCLNRFKNLLLTAILDNHTKVARIINEKYLIII